jgi:RNA recognition motif-containing protein
MAPDFGLTLKLTNLPLETTESDVRRYLREFPGMKDKYIKRVSQPCPYSRLAQGSLSSVVTLRNPDIAKRLCDHVKNDQRNFHAERAGSYSTVAIDSAFLDLTTLYSSTKGPGGKPTVE